MSAETIPADVRAWEYETQIFDGSWHSVVTREHPDALGNNYRALQPLIADRSTRPAKPTTPVAESGDGEVSLADACKPWEFASGPVPDYDSPLYEVFVAGMLYTEQLLANHLGVKRYDAGDGSEDFDRDATMSLVNILTEAGLWDKDEWRSTLEAERARANAAEQRAADALARAEKAEEDERDRLYELASNHGGWAVPVVVPGFIRDCGGAMLPHERRASREAQPATDGGDNG